jgi:hypothetical protein
MPQGMTIDVLVGVLVGITPVRAAYMAEIVRGGLQAIPRGQLERRHRSALGYWQTQRKIVPAAGAGDGRAEHDEQLISILKDNLAGDDRVAVRAAPVRWRWPSTPTSSGGVQDRGLPLHHCHLLRDLLRDVALQLWVERQLASQPHR